MRVYIILKTPIVNFFVILNKWWCFGFVCMRLCLCSCVCVWLCFIGKRGRKKTLKFSNLLYLISSNYEINIKYAENLCFLNIDGWAAAIVCANSKLPKTFIVVTAQKIFNLILSIYFIWEEEFSSLSIQWKVIFHNYSMIRKNSFHWKCFHLSSLWQILCLLSGWRAVTLFALTTFL